MQRLRMFVASYRASDAGRERRKSESRMGGVQQRKGFAAGGGDGIDQIKYFTTHFRRCARRVVRGGAEPGDYGAAEKKV